MVSSNLSRSRNLPEPLTTITALAISWGFLITQVRHHWGGESYYNFGWFVPVMAIWLLLKNINDLQPKATRRESVYVLLGAVFLSPVLLFHALSEVNPFWRLPLWLQACSISGFTLVLFHRAYGMKGVVRAAFPLFFLCTMIPWPYRLEVQIVQSLTQVVVAFSLQGLHFLGYPVVLAGNSLTLGEMHIGVNEACSGIRSLQALFMVTLFLGSLFNQTVPRRLFTIVLLPLIVIFINTIRAIFLSLQVIENGQAAYDKWHDPAGYIAFGASMVLIYGAIELLNKGLPSGSSSQPLDLKKIQQSWATMKAPLASLLFPIIALAYFMMVEGWFQYHEMKAPADRGWKLEMPVEDDSTTRYLEIHKQVSSLLGYSFGHRFQHMIERKSGVEVYYYGYTDENKLSSVSSYGHSPAICMESIGAKLIEELDPLMLEKGSLHIPVKHYLFELPKDNYQMHVFWIVWENRNMDIPPEYLTDLDYRAQLIQLLHGRRDFSRKVLLLSYFGSTDSAVARESVHGVLQDWVTPIAD